MPEINHYKTKRKTHVSENKLVSKQFFHDLAPTELWHIINRGSDLIGESGIHWHHLNILSVASWGFLNLQQRHSNAKFNRRGRTGNWCWVPWMRIWTFQLSCFIKEHGYVGIYVGPMQRGIECENGWPCWGWRPTIMARSLLSPAPTSGSRIMTREEFTGGCGWVRGRNSWSAPGLPSTTPHSLT